MSSTARQSASTRGRSKSKDSKKSQPTPPLPDLRLVTIADVDYFIYWERLGIGGSFFLPTLLPAKDVARALRPLEKKLKIALEVRTRCEYGAYGVRVWRVR
jgi:hypothetical protein